MSIDMSKLLSTKQAAEKVGVTRRHILLSIQRGNLSANKIGYTWLINEDDLMEWHHHRHNRGNPEFVKKIIK